MKYRTIHYQIGIIHANLLDLQYYLRHIGIGQFSALELQKIEYALTFLRKHLDKPIMMPPINKLLPE